MDARLGPLRRARLRRQPAPFWSGCQRRVRGSKPVTQMIDQHFANERAPVHFDESDAKCDRTLYWIPLARNPRFTHYLLHAKLGVEAMEALVILPGFKGTAVYDQWEPYYNHIQCKHALCGSHLPRDLGAVKE